MSRPFCVLSVQDAEPGAEFRIVYRHRAIAGRHNSIGAAQQHVLRHHALKPGRHPDIAKPVDRQRLGRQAHPGDIGLQPAVRNLCAATGPQRGPFRVRPCRRRWPPQWSAKRRRCRQAEFYACRCHLLAVAIPVNGRLAAMPDHKFAANFAPGQSLWDGGNVCRRLGRIGTVNP